LELEQPNKCGGIKPVNDIPTLPLDNWFFLTRVFNVSSQQKKSQDKHFQQK
jgi:hypothetical protein